MLTVEKVGLDAGNSKNQVLRFDGDPDKPLHCKLQGKRKTNTKIMVSEDPSPPWIAAPQAAIKG